ncbi:MAG TPA: Wzz/FepE/Etk N-terminal domain-containing protein [Terriglobales bacterium]|nr:Wzz/FepE/Etk N-terminal domain-containing protein [Terriglobales bacterium]
MPTPSSFRPPLWSQLRALLLRRRWWLLLSLCAGWLGVVSLLWLLPPVYSSQALLLVEQQSVPQNYVQPNVEFNPQAQLQSLGQQVLSRDRLAQIVEQFHLYPRLVSSQGEDAAVRRMRLAITLEPVSLADLPTPPQGPWSAVRLAFSASSPQTAQGVAERLTQAFIQENLRATQAASSRTTDFLREQLQQAGQQVQQAQQQLQQYEHGHLGLLPGQGQANLAIVMSLQSQLGASQAALLNNQQEIVTDRSLLAQAPSAHVLRLRSQIAALRARLNQLRSRYTDRYPAVGQAGQQLAALQAQLAQASSGQPPAPSSVADSPELAQARSRLQAAEAQLPRQQNDVVRLQKQLAQYERRLDLAPMPAAQLAALNTQLQQVQANYQARQAKLANSEMASQLEQEQGGAQFQLVNAPTVPRRPVWPNPALLAPLGLAAGLLLGLAICLLMELSGDCIGGEAELLALGLTPVWIHIPPLYSRGQRFRRRLRFGLEWISAGALLSLLVLGNIWMLRQGL